MDFVWLAGRLLFSSVFIVSALGNLKDLEHTTKMAASSGAPFPKLLSLFASLLALLGGLSIAFGYQAEIGAIFTLLFLLPVTFMVHRFWKYSDPMAVGNHRGHFWKNIGLIGGAMFILS